MPILVKLPSDKDTPDEWAIIELQGDLESRGKTDVALQFIGDLAYNKYGQPVSTNCIILIGHLS